MSATGAVPFAIGKEREDHLETGVSRNPRVFLFNSP